MENPAGNVERQPQALILFRYSQTAPLSVESPHPRLFLLHGRRSTEDGNVCPIICFEL